MNSDLIQSSEKASLSEVQLTENKIGVKFPETFKEFVIKNNGAKFRDAVIETNSNEPENDVFEVRQFLPLKKISATIMEDQNPAIVFFAEDSTGNYFAFKKTEMEAVYFWDHETDNMIFVRNNFEDFITNIKKDEFEVVVPEDATGWIDPEFLKQQKDQGNA